jgi:serine/threonine-protein kinase
MVDSPAPVPPDKYAVGDVIAEKYCLEYLLGEGGQAWVWKARHLSLDTFVALKVLRGTNDSPQTRRLWQEARAAASLGHPAIVRVFDIGEAATGDPFLVMELLQGDNLADRLVERGRLSPVEAVRLLLPIADALAAAHAKGLVHRDLKPDNVFLSLGHGVVQPKLLDFGIVKVQQTASDWQGKSTATGAVVGSPAYLSPEQARGSSDIDQRADVWGLCVTLYECLTGEVPFTGNNYNALLRSIVEDEPQSILELGVNEPELWQLVKRGLAKSRDERWPSTLELGRALALWASERGVQDDVCRTPLDGKWLFSSARSVNAASSQPSSARRGRKALLGALVTLTLLIAAGVQWSRSSQAPRIETSAETAAPVSSGAVRSNGISEPSVAPSPIPIEASPFASQVPSALNSARAALSARPLASTSRAGEARPGRPGGEAISPKPTPRAKASGDLYLISPY